ncbi:MAG: hypothetical protein M5U12_07045 [Verrucomicrobia bacterium]|nr:hypothetical protein [Verrucomicrobiota bacterium]
MTDLPADDGAAKALLGEDVPQGLGAARGAGHGADTGAVGLRLEKAADAVLVGRLAGGDRGPQHRGEARLEGGEVGDHAGLDQPGQMRHLAGIQERVDEIPIGTVPADQ